MNTGTPSSSNQETDKKNAIRVYKDILHFYTRLPNNNHINEIVIKHKLAQLYSEEGDEARALKLCNEILETQLPDSTEQKLSDRLNKVQSLKKELSGS
jgi:hypothetical protein